MKIIRNLSIRTKLLIGFISIAVFLGVIGVTAGFGLTHIQNNTEKIYDVNLKNIDLLPKFHVHFLLA